MPAKINFLLSRALLLAFLHLPTKAHSLPKLISTLSVSTQSQSVNSEDPLVLGGTYTYSLSASWPVSQIGAALIVGLSHDYHEHSFDGQTSDFEDARASMSKTFTPQEASLWQTYLDTVTLSFNSVLPLSRVSKRSSLQAKLGPAISLKKHLGPWTLSQRFGYLYGLYEYTTALGYYENDTKKINAPHRITSTSQLNYELTSLLSLSTGLSYLHDINYFNRAASSTLTQISIDYQLMSQLSLSGGVSTLSGTLTPDGQHYRYVAFDADQASAFFLVDFSF